MKSSLAALIACALVSLPAAAASRAKPLQLKIGPEKMILPGGLQPFMFRSQKGTLVAQAQMPLPADYVEPTENAYGYPGNTRSVNGGESWQRWSPGAGQGVGPIFEGSATQLGDGTILLIEWVAAGPRPGGWFLGKIWESRDDWKTLTGPFDARIELPQAKRGFDDGGKPYGGVDFHRSLIELPGGDLLATAYCWFKGDDTPSTYMRSMLKFRSVLLQSKDRGRTWTLRSTIAVDPTVGEEGFNEPVLVRLTQGRHRGRLIVHLRIGSNKALTQPRYNLIQQAESDDDGLTWTKPHPLNFQGVDPDLIEMQNGVLVAGFGWRTPEWSDRRLNPRHPDPKTYHIPRRYGPNHGNYVAFSQDQGETWTQITQVTRGPTTSYVTVREVKPGRLLLVYDKFAWDHAACAIAGKFIDVSREEDGKP